MNTKEFSTYKEKLQNPKWQKKRLEIFQRDNFTCVVCFDSDNTLHVHHVDYIPGIAPWDYPNDMLKTYCARCHEKENDRDKVEKYLYNTLKMKGFAVYDLLALSLIVDQDKEFTEDLLRALRRI